MTAAGSLVPLAFVNQDADPFLAELYRRVHGVKMLKEITLENMRGGRALLIEFTATHWIRPHTYIDLHKTLLAMCLHLHLHCSAIAGVLPPVLPLCLYSLA